MQTLNNKFYVNAYKNHGVSAKGVHWDSKETQYLRFKILTSFIKDIENSSLIDLGCGYGEYLNFLNEQNIKPEIYLGVDCEDFILNIAKKRFPNNTFLKCDIVENEIIKADYLLCSGTLNLLNKNTFLKAIINCFIASKKGFIFNFLTKESIHKLEKPMIYNFCKKLANKVTIEDGYLDNDCTMFLQK